MLAVNPCGSELIHKSLASKQCANEVLYLSAYMSKLLAMQDNLVKASARELLRTDSLRLTTKEPH